MGTLVQDVHYSLRTFRKSPSFVLATVLALAFGIGMNSAVFTLLNAIALKPLPVRNANEVVTVYQTMRGLRNRNVHGDPSFFSYAEYAAYRDQNAVFTGIAAYAKANLTLAGDQAREVAGHLATCNYFDVLSGPLVLGRGFRADECGAPGSAPVVVLSYGLWKNQFGGNPEILGRSITLNGHPFSVIGVAPEGFRDASITVAEVWTPLVMQEQWVPNRQFLNDTNLSWLEVAGRLKPGVTPAEARVNLSVIAARLDTQSPPRSTTIYVDRATLMNNPRARGAVLGVGAVVLAAVSLVLLIACANLANLLLARGTARQKEIALRLAIGASRVRVIRQLLTESLLLAFAGGAAGLLAAWATLGAIVPILMSQLPSEAQWLRPDLSPDVRIVAYSILLSIATAAGFGMIPAVQVSRIDLNSALKDSGATFGRISRRWIRGSLVAAQVAVCLILLIAAGLLARGVYAAQNIDPGFRMNDVTVANFDLTLQGYDATRATAFHRGLSERLSAIAGIQEVGFAQPVPLSGDRHGNSVTLEGHDGERSVYYASVSANYFELLDVPILRGRSFRDLDISANPNVVVVSEAAARNLWPGEEPVGKRLRFGRDTVNSEVIGVAKDLHSLSLSERDRNFVYVPLRPGDYLSASLLARGTSTAATMTTAIQSEAHGLDANLLVRTGELEKNLNLWQVPSRITAVLGLVLGLAGLLLALLGIFGVVAYAVSQRTKEIGIRVSLGAQKNDVLRLMMGGTMRFVIAGILVGLAGSAAVSRILQSLLFGVSPLDPIVFVGVSGLLGGVAALASYIPARRATLVDPMSALHHE